MTRITITTETIDSTKANDAERGAESRADSARRRENSQAGAVTDIGDPATGPVLLSPHGSGGHERSRMTAAQGLADVAMHHNSADDRIL